MLKFFRKKKKVRVIKCSELLKLGKVEGLKNCYNVTIDKSLQNFQDKIQKVLNTLGIYDDQVWVEAYLEYRKNYKVYDRVPNLLLYKIPILLVKANPGIAKEVNKEFAFQYYIPSPAYYETLPEEFQLEPWIEHIFKNMYSKVYGYLSEEKMTLDEYVHFIRFNRCKNWDILRNKPGSYWDYFNECMDVIISFTEEDNMITVANILQRFAEEMKDHYTNF